MVNKKEVKKALYYYLGNFTGNPAEMVDALNKKGFNLTYDMTLDDVFGKVLEKYKEDNK